MASTIIIVCPFLIFAPTSINFFAPGSGAKYAVPIIGDLILVPSSSSSLNTALLLEITTFPFDCSTVALDAFDTLILIFPS